MGIRRVGSTLYVWLACLTKVQMLCVERWLLATGQQPLSKSKFVHFHTTPKYSLLETCYRPVHLQDLAALSKHHHLRHPPNSAPFSHCHYHPPRGAKRIATRACRTGRNTTGLTCGLCGNEGVDKARRVCATADCVPLSQPATVHTHTRIHTHTPWRARHCVCLA